MNNKKDLIKIVLTVVILGSVAALSVWAINGRKQISAYPFVSAKRGDLTNEVKLSGTVKPANEVQLSFQAGGKVTKADGKVGQKVKAGQVLAQLSSTDIRADMSQSSASLAVAGAQMAQLQSALTLQNLKKQEMLKGAKPEEVNLAVTQVANAQRALDDAKLNLANVKNKTTVDYRNAQNNINNLLLDAYAKSNDAYNRQTGEIYDMSSGIPNLLLNSAMDTVAKSNAESSRASAAGAVENLQAMTTSVAADYSNAGKLAMDAQVELSTVWNHLSATLNAVNKTAPSQEMPQSKLDSYRSSIASAMSAINQSKTALNGYSQAVESVKASNATALQTAEISVTAANNALNVAKDTLAIKKSGATADQLAEQDIVIRQAQSALDMQRAQMAVIRAAMAKVASQLDKTIIKSPIDGVITDFEPKTGETVAPNMPLVKIMTLSKFQIEGFVTENDLAKIKITDKADVTLDSYGKSKVYKAKVVQIDPAATLSKGNPTYKVTLEFEKEDASIRAGLTANVSIVISRETGVVTIPESSIIKDGENRYVIVDNGSATGERRAVVISQVANGIASVSSGLNDNERVADFSALPIK